MSTDPTTPEEPQGDVTPVTPEASVEETVAEPEIPTVEAAEPGVVAGLEIGSEAADEPSVEDLADRPDPLIRGKVDRYGVAWGTGRRKTAVARVRLKDGNGQITVNGRTLEEYFPVVRDQRLIYGPLEAVEAAGKVDVIVNVRGGGPTGQTGAVVLGIARALQAKDPSTHHTLSTGGFLTRDGRMVERKKYGFKKARKSFQFSKR